MLEEGSYQTECSTERVLRMYVEWLTDHSNFSIGYRDWTLAEYIALLKMAIKQKVCELISHSAIIVRRLINKYNVEGVLNKLRKLLGLDCKCEDLKELWQKVDQLVPFRITLALCTGQT